MDFVVELMILGFISLLLTFFQDEIDKWCIPEKLTERWLPCAKDKGDTASTANYQIPAGGRRLLAEDVANSTCPAVWNSQYCHIKPYHQYVYLNVICFKIAGKGTYRINWCSSWPSLPHLHISNCPRTQLYAHSTPWRDKGIFAANIGQYIYATKLNNFLVCRHADAVDKSVAEVGRCYQNTEYRWP